MSGVIQVAPARGSEHGGAPARRVDARADRRVTMLAIALAAVFVGLTIASLVLPAGVRQGAWLPLHLLLAGAASTAIAGVMPFFSAAVAGAQPASTQVRMAGVLGVAVGALLISVGRIDPTDIPTAGLGGLIYIGGMTLVGAATLKPLGNALGSRRIIVGAIYGIAIADVIVGASLSTAFLLGWAPVIDAWGVLKPAHAWLNLYGFVSLVIAGSLLHLLPTVAGARIGRSKASVATFACLALGAPITALGFAIGSYAVALTGAAIVVGGGVALLVHAITVFGSRAAWSSDAGWHRFTMWSLVACTAWFLVGAGLGTAQVFSGGATAAGWDLARVAAALGIGWVAQALIGAWSHLVPAVGPGSHAQHAVQRQWLGRVSVPRLLALNIGVAALIVGGPILHNTVIEAAGLVLVVVAGISALVLFVIAIVQSRTRLVRSQA